MKGGGRDARLRATDADPSGLFLETTEPWPLHADVQLDVQVGAEERISLCGTVVRVMRKERLAPDETPGMGVQLRPPDPSMSDRWRSWLAKAGGSVRPEDRRVFPREPARLKVRIRATDPDRIEAFFTENVGPGGVLFATDLPFTMGQRIELVLIDPGTDMAFPVSGDVVRVDAPSEDGSSLRRVAVQFSTPEFETFRRLTKARPAD